jgi:hypothetical protein
MKLQHATTTQHHEEIIVCVCVSRVVSCKEKLDPFQLFWQHAPMEQKLSLLDGCPLACGSRPAFQKQRHLQHHEQIRDRVGAQLFIVRSDFRKSCGTRVPFYHSGLSKCEAHNFKHGK